MATSNAILAEIRRNRILMGLLAGGLVLSSTVVSNYREMFPLSVQQPQAFAALTPPEAANGGKQGGGSGYSHYGRGGYPVGRRYEHHANAPLVADSRPVADRLSGQAAPQAPTQQAPTQLAAIDPISSSSSSGGPSTSTSGGPDPIISSTSGGPITTASGGPTTTTSSGGSTTTSGGPTSTTSSGGSTTTTTSGGLTTTTSGGTITSSGGGTDPVPPAPEPATWAMMIFGFALVGGLAYRRSRRGAASA